MSDAIGTTIETGVRIAGPDGVLTLFVDETGATQIGMAITRRGRLGRGEQTASIPVGERAAAAVRAWFEGAFEGAQILRGQHSPKHRRSKESHHDGKQRSLNLGGERIDTTAGPKGRLP